MSTTIPISQVEPELELRIRLAESVEEMRARFEGFVVECRTRIVRGDRNQVTNRSGGIIGELRDHLPVNFVVAQ